MVNHNKKRLYARINSIIMVCLLTMITGLLMWLSNRYTIEFDWTANARHSLSPASVDVLDNMPAAIEITSYASNEPILREAIDTFIKRYQRVKPDITLKFKDRFAYPEELQEKGITIDGELLVQYQGRSEHVRTIQEKNLTDTLYRLAKTNQKTIAFIEGHGERSPFGDKNTDVKLFAEQLKRQNIQVQAFNPANIKNIPDNIKLLVVASPRIDLLTNEVDLILNYVNDGGNLLWITDKTILHKLDPLAQQLGISIRQGMIIDPAGEQLGSTDFVLIPPKSYPPHPITQNFDYITLFHQAVSIIHSNTHQDWRIQAIVNSSPNSWNEINLATIQFDKDVDTQGPLPISIALHRTHTKAQPDGSEQDQQQRIVIIGDGDFISNTYLNNGGNMDLGVRMINWLIHDDSFIQIPPKIATDTQLNMSLNLIGAMGILFLFIIPLLLFITGITIGLKRKNK